MTSSVKLYGQIRAEVVTLIREYQSGYVGVGEVVDPFVLFLILVGPLPPLGLRLPVSSPHLSGIIDTSGEFTHIVYSVKSSAY
jgi:hypothetical protein